MDGPVKLLPLCLVIRLAVFKSFFFLLFFLNIVIALKPWFSFMAKNIWKIKKKKKKFCFYFYLFIIIIIIICVLMFVW